MTGNACKLILVLLGCAAPLLAAVIGAEPNSNPYGELYSATAADQGPRQPLPSVDNRLQDETISLESDSQPVTRSDAGDRSSAGGMPAERVGEKPAAPAQAVGLGAVERPSASVQSLANTGRSWILVVAGLGLLLSLAAAGYLAWLRAPQMETPVSVLLPRGLPQASDNSPGLPAADEQARPERRAA